VARVWAGHGILSVKVPQNPTRNNKLSFKTEFGSGQAFQEACFEIPLGRIQSSGVSCNLISR